MKDTISTLMDGELDDRSAAQTIDTLGRDREALETWRRYHVIGDAMRGSPVRLSGGFASRLSERLAKEPTVLAPTRRPIEARRLFAPLPVAASFAAVALVGWLAFAPQQPGTPPGAEMAKASQAVRTAPAAPAQSVAQARPVMIPLPSATNDYLLAHQGFSPRVSLQGMAPYVRTVSEQGGEPAR